MKKRLLIGVVMAMVALLTVSCNKNRFDFDNLSSVEGSGHWKLPIGSVNTTLRNVFSQLAEDGLISYDNEGNLQITYHFEMDNVIKGSNFLTLGTYNFSTDISFENPYVGVPLPEPIDTVYYFRQLLEITTDSATIETAVIKSGSLLLTVMSNLGNVTEVVMSSPDITMPNGDSLHTTNNEVDLAGATFRLHDENGVVDSTLVLNYAIHYQMDGLNDENYEITTIVGLNDIKIQELTGHINEFVYEFELDTSFMLPVDNVSGELKLVGAEIGINEKNTFGNLYAQMLINYAEFYGDNVAPAPIFHNYPFMVNIVPSYTYTTALSEGSLDIDITTGHNAIRLAGLVDFNPLGADRLVSIYDTSVLGLTVDARIPMQFNIPGVAYRDTFDISFESIDITDFINEVDLHIGFDSELPFNISAQLYTLDSITGRVTDSLLVNELEIDGSFDGRPVMTETVASITHERLNSLFASRQMVMRAAINTGGNDILINLDNGLGLTLKADVIYDGTIDFDN